MFTAPAELIGGDEEVLLGTADRIARHGFISPKWQEDDRVFNPKLLDGQGYSKYGLGQSLLIIPSTWAFRAASSAPGFRSQVFYFLAVFAVPASIGALVNTVFFLTCLRLGYSLAAAFVSSLLLGLTTMAWPYSQTLFSDPTLGLLWLLALYGLLSFKETDKTFWLGISGAAAGFAALTKIIAVYALPVFAGYLLFLLNMKYRSPEAIDRGRPLAYAVAWFVLPLLFFACAILWHNNIRHGSLLSFGYIDGNTDTSRDAEFGFNTPFLAGVYGQLFSSGKGFFFYNASALLAFFGWRRLFRRHPAETLTVLSIIGGALLLYGKWWAWPGGWNWGPRFWSCQPPFFMLLGAAFIEKLLQDLKARGTGYARSLTAVSLLVTVSFLTQIPGLCIRSANYILLAAKADVLQGKFYDPQSWNVRDDMLQLNFIPEFSPLAGHWWMMRVIYHRDDGDFWEVYHSPPWKSLNPQWIIKEFHPEFFSYNIWWLNASIIKPAEKLPILITAFLLLTTAIAAFADGARLVRRQALLSSEHSSNQ
ncbi:MAG: glycosyltransferase family 39 protein [Nitrospinae bacterium]|nr:glycosyltransferase family 39 protein [Nitrospinota bacterium]